MVNNNKPYICRMWLTVQAERSWSTCSMAAFRSSRQTTLPLRLTSTLPGTCLWHLPNMYSTVYFTHSKNWKKTACLLSLRTAIAKYNVHVLNIHDTEFTNIYRKSVLHLFTYRFAEYLSRCSTYAVNFGKLSNNKMTNTSLSQNWPSPDQNDECAQPARFHRLPHLQSPSR